MPNLCWQDLQRGVILIVSAAFTCLLLLALVVSPAIPADAHSSANVDGLGQATTQDTLASPQNALPAFSQGPASPTCGLGWYSVNTPNPNGGSNILGALKVIAEN